MSHSLEPDAYFGTPPSDAAFLRRRVLTPVNEQCVTCNQPVTESDSGRFVAVRIAPRAFRWSPQHFECPILPPAATSRN